MPKTPLNVTFQFMGDQFGHAWYFNQFRCAPFESSILVTTALITPGGGSPAVNGFVVSRRDLEGTKERSKKYFEDVSAEFDSEDEPCPELLVAPTRIYPVNHINLSRIDEVGEICLYRYAMNTLLNTLRKPENVTDRSTMKTPTEKSVVPCYPVVMFRSDVRVQVALLKELFEA
jgi:hypothetical protein